LLNGTWTWEGNRFTYLCMKMYVSRADQSDRECSSRLCNDCTLKSPESVNRSWFDRWKREGARGRLYHLLRHCWPFRLCPIRAATSAQDIPSTLHPCWGIIDLTIVVNSSDSSGVQAPTWSSTSIQKVTCHSLFGLLYLSDARRDERDGSGSDLCSWQGIAQAVWISHPTSDQVLGRL
jgi:hypothetical protein